ncbi:uncharacterized protein LOC129602498 [Paramacrobiotus metropolitanus]|uniref:uncharacterized protein LOC129602498 n=1 Tax=Paramacrobiotus metropolitanus TaxID=2943436 RepID=UPI00244561AE|nr:uncharacterized protein LOC129602498 [Paramacrobiotus metropolitanus]XP_055357510.1 uncharacterized protein LOC129602498 [Paramacrobiotus metropolitanus]
MFRRRRPSPTPTTITVDDSFADNDAIHSRGITHTAHQETRKERRFAFINTGRTVCDTKCVCKIAHRHKNKPRLIVRRVLSHTFRGGICFLLCVLDNPRSAPTYLKQCVVQRELRVEYADYLKSTGGIPRTVQDFWNVDTEIAMRDALFPELPEFEQRRQREIAASDDTLQWSKRTNNGRSTIQITAEATSPALKLVTNSMQSSKPPREPGKSVKNVNKRPKVEYKRAEDALSKKGTESKVTRPKTALTTDTGNHVTDTVTGVKNANSDRRTGSPEIPPPLQINTDRLWVEERIIGAFLQSPQKKSTRGRPRSVRWFLVKWKALSVEDSSWKCESELQCTKDIQAFLKRHGRPTLQKRKILTSEGVQYEELQLKKKRIQPLLAEGEDLTDAIVC